MTIACVAWGSIVWDPQGLPIHGSWFSDGPRLRIEFARQSSDGRLTLVIVPTGPEFNTLWAPFDLDSVTDAVRALARREGAVRHGNIGVWTNTDSEESSPEIICRWARKLKLDSAVWTALLPRFEGKNGRVPTEDQAVDYLRNLPDKSQHAAERYIRMAPLQIDTPYRRRFEREFGWTPIATR